MPGVNDINFELVEAACMASCSSSGLPEEEQRTYVSLGALDLAIERSHPDTEALFRLLNLIQLEQEKRGSHDSQVTRTKRSRP